MEERAKVFFGILFSLCLLFARPLFALVETEGLPPPEAPGDSEIPEELEAAADLEGLEPDLVPEQEEAAPLERYASFLDSVKKIRMLDDKDDVFSAVHKDTGKRVLTNFANGKGQRRFYDEKLRLEKVEYWKVSGSSAQSSLERVVTYNPTADGEGVASIFEKNYAESSETRTFYHKNGNVKSRRKNYFDKDSKLVSFEIYTCTYDSSWRVVKDRLQKYSVNGKAVALSSDEVHVTKYSGKNVVETSYYKNSVLRVRTFYIDGKSDEYARATYFDGGIIVRDFYRGNIKISSTVDNGERNEN